MNKLIKSFVADESGVTAMEYGLIAALILVAIISVLGILGGELKKTFGIINDGLVAGNAKK